MELQSPNGDNFSLRAAGYQHLSPRGDLYDDNRLRIHVTAAIAGRSWQTIDACLLTWELDELAQWADLLAEAPPQKTHVAFLEPNLSFEAIRWSPEAVVVRVFFEQESRPPWARDRRAAQDVWLELELVPGDWRAWATELRAQCARFPPRGQR